MLLGLVCLSMATGLALGRSLSHTDPVASAPHRATSPDVRHPDIAAAALTDLREAATLGNEAATRDLASLLLDRFDSSGNEVDLFEAVVWMDRNLYAPQNVSLAQRVAAAHCDHPVMRWHALCAPGN